MGDHSELERRLVEELAAAGKHTGYQTLPPWLDVTLPELQRRTTGIRIDERRYEWFKSEFDGPVRSAIDIGANLGYFSFRVARDYGANVVAYEPFSPHARAMEIVREMCGMTDDEVRVEPCGVGLADIDALPTVDLLMLFNVMQHAGEDFDADLVTSVEQWRPYAQEYLNRLTKKTKALWFQMGYRWLGHDRFLCDDTDVLPFSADLLTSAGWRIRSCGLIRSIRSPRYVSTAPGASDWASSGVVARPPRVVRKVAQALGVQTLGDRAYHRFAQRPIWVCERLD